MKQFSYLWLSIFIILTACTTTNNVNSGHFIQKRKFQNGFSVKNLIHSKKSESNVENSQEKLEARKVNSKDSSQIAQIKIEDSIKFHDYSGKEPEALIADQSNDLNLIQTEKPGLIEKDSPDPSGQLGRIKNEINPLLESSLKNKSLLEAKENNEGKWKLVLSIFLSLLLILFAILLINEIVAGVGIGAIIVPIVLSIGAFILIRSFVKNRSKKFNGLEIGLLILSLSALTLSLVFVGMIAAGWTVIFLITSGILFLGMAIIMAVLLVRSSRPFRNQSPKSAKKVLFVFLALTALLIIISALLMNYSGAYLLAQFFMGFSFGFFLITLFLLIRYLVKRRKEKKGRN